MSDFNLGMLLNTITGNVSGIIFTLDKNGIFTLSDGKGLAALGLKPGQVVGLSAFDVYKDQPAIVSDIQRALAGEEFKNTVKIGEIYYETNYASIKNIQGEFDGVLGIATDVTEHKKAADAISQSEQRLGWIVRQSPLALIEWNLDFEIAGWNDSAEHIFGYAHEEALGKNGVDLIFAPEMRAVIEQTWQDLLTQKGGTHNTHINTTKDGRTITCEWYNTPLVASDGRVIGVASLVQDITSQKQAEIELRNAAERQRAILEASPTPTILTRLDGTILYCNHEFGRQFGYEPQLLIGKPVPDLYLHAEDREAVLARFQKDGIVQNMEILARRADGSGRWVMISIHNFEYGGESVLLSSVVDISERKATEEIIGESEQRLSLLIESSPLAVIEWDINYHVISWNPAAEKIFGYSRQQAIGRHAAGLIIPAEQRPTADQLWSDLLAQRSGTRSTQENLTKDGRTIICEWYNTPLVDEKGEVFGVESLVQDITERTLAEKRLSEREEQFRNAIAAADAVPYYIEYGAEKYRFMGEAIEKLTGYKADEITPAILGSMIQETSMYGSDTGLSREKAIEMTRSGQSADWKADYRIIDRNGVTRWLSDASVQVLDEKGRPDGAIGILQDITDRKQADTAIRESEARFRSIYENSSIGMYRTTPGGRILLANPAILQMLGYESFEELNRRNLEEEGYSENRPRSEFQQRIENDGVVRGHESIWTRKDGSVVYVRESATAIRDENGKTLYYEGTVEDITEWRLAQEEMRKSQRRLSLLVERSPLAVIEWSTKFEVLSWNPAAEQIFGYSKEEAVGRHAAGLVVSESAKVIVDRIWSSMLHQKGGSTSTNENITKDGRKIMCEWFNTPIVDETGQTIGLTSLVEDITTRLMLEEQIEQSLDKRGRQVEITNQVAQEIASVTQINTIFERVVKLVKERFGYYHTQIFRFDSGLNAVALVTGYGETGQRMLAAGHKLEMGRGVVGTAAATGRSVLASDVRRDKDWRPNPFLPDTKGEVAVPIKFQDQVLGILDVQSDEADILSQDDVLMLESLAGQIAIAIENTRLREEMSLRLEEIESLYRSMSHSGWEQFRNESNVPTGYMYRQGEIQETGNAWAEEIASAVTQNELVAPETPDAPIIAPLEIRGEIIGTLGIEQDPNRPLLPEDIEMIRSISDQVSQALESARLFEQTRQALNQANIFRQLVNATGQGIGMANLDASMVYANESLARIFGENAPEDVVGNDILDYYPPRSHEYLREEVIGEAFREGEWNGELEVLSQTGVEVPTLNDIFILKNDNGEPQYIANVVTDITERKNAEEALRRQNEYLASAAEVSRLITSTLDLPTLFDRTVNLLRARFGYEHVAIFLIDEASYNAVYMEGTGSAGEELKENAYSVAVGSKSIIGHVSANGKTLAVNNTALEPLYKAHRLMPNTRAEAVIPLIVSKRIIGVLDIHSNEINAFHEEDVAVLETLSDQIAVGIDNARSYLLTQKAVEDLREADRIKTQFLANMSHELRTPLNSIIGFSRVILKGIDGPINEQQQQDLSAIYHSGQHLLGLINDILDVSKIEAGKMELALEEVNLSETITSVMSTGAGLIKDKPVKLVKNIAPDTPTIRADGMRVRQVLINLVSNASKFTDEGFITISAAPQVSSEGVYEVLLSVTDTGPGISPEDQNKLFQAFSQVDSSPTRKTGGTGLGLSICKRLVEMHGGRIGVHSAEGKGSTFYFTIPAFHQPVKEEIAPDAGQTILCIDDDPQIVALYERFLGAQGYIVVPVHEPAKAKEKAKEIKPYAITLDIMMPEMDGWQVLEQLKSDPETRSIPVIVCSIVEEEEKGFSLGAADYLVKPIMEEELVSALNRLNAAGNIQQVLIIDDSADDLRLMEKVLTEHSQYKAILADSGEKGWDIIANQPPQAIILDLFMPDLDGFAILERLRTSPNLRDIPVIVVSGMDLSPEQKQQLDNLGKRLLQKGMVTEEELLGTLERSLKQLSKK
jgi:PAS domain S-box-containing protein